MKLAGIIVVLQQQKTTNLIYFCFIFILFLIKSEMYLPLVAVLEHVLLTFISRVKQQVSRITDNKTALMLVIKEGKGPTLSAIMERRKPAILLLRAYTDSDGIDALDNVEKQSDINPLSPSPGDTLSRRSTSSGDDKVHNPLDDIVDGVEGDTSRGDRG